MTSRLPHATLSEITRQVAREWHEQGKSLPVPPDIDTMSAAEELAFWDEVERRFEMQGAGKVDDADLL